MNKMFECFDSLGGVFGRALSVTQCTVLRITIFDTIPNLRLYSSNRGFDEADN